MANTNVLTRGKKKKADEAVQAGNLAEARTLYQAVCRSDASDVEAWVKLGVVQRRLGDAAGAEASGRRAVALQPRLGLAHYGLGTALQSQGRLAEAIQCYREAIRLQANLADAHYLLGSALLETGAAGDAIASYDMAIALRPNFAEALADLGAARIETGAFEQAADALQRALALQPGNAVALSNMGNLLRLQGKVAEALESYRHALRLAPDAVDILAGLATLLEKTGQLDEARELLERGMRLAPEHPALALLAAHLARHERRWQDAVALLEKVRGQPLRADLCAEIHLLLAQLYDQLGDAGRAFPLIVEGHRLAASLNQTGKAAERYLAQVRAMRAQATERLAACPAPAPEPDEEAAPAFLIGFPRSGTTLLEQILDSHPAIQTLEERGSVAAMAEGFRSLAGDRPDALASLSADAIRELRRLYFAEVARNIERRPGTLLIDKMPLNTAQVPLIWRVFPQARFILAIRHPCDVCLSCLMQNFAVNDAMSSFHTLEGTVCLYAEVISAWEQYSHQLPLAWQAVRYEDLVADVAGEARKLLEFLGVGWNDAVLDYAGHARERGAINTPSYHQVTQPIYQHARYRWQRYAGELAPYLATLQPFIEEFGYADVLKPPA